MNILFVTDHRVTPRSGGIERVVGALGGAMTERLGWTVRYACIDATEPGESAFDFRQSNVAYRLETDLNHEEVDCVIDELMVGENVRRYVPEIYLACRKSGVSHVYSYHMMPGYELADGRDLDFVWYALRRGHNVRHNLVRLGMTLWTRLFGQGRFMGRMQEKYGVAYGYADVVVLESERYVEDYLRMCGGENRERVVAMLNPLPYDEDVAEKLRLTEKKKRVMLVARMEEDQKRVWLALKVWKEVVRHDDLKDWTLTMIGEGTDWDLYRRRAEETGLERVEFVGNQALDNYYAQSAILMMTSAYEGLPMVLLEAQQTGVVPIAFDSFASVHEVITDGENGVLARNNDVAGYASALVGLMRDREKRKQMAEQARETCRRFGMGEIVRQWDRLLQDVRKKREENGNGGRE